MPVDIPLNGKLANAGPRAAELAAAGADGVFTFEGQHDAFAPLVLAAASAPVMVYPAVAIAFPRSPMHLANIAWDLQELSGGRFMLGLGSQVRAHVERRFSAKFDPPIGRMADLVRAVTAILASWQSGEALDYQGEYYTHTLMTPNFNPGPNPHGVAPIVLAAVGPQMTRLAGEVAGGALLHPFNTPRFVAEQWLPELSAGAAKSGRSLDDLTVIGQVIVATARDDRELTAARDAARRMLSFYASTPAYRPPLVLEGWEDVQPELNKLAKSNRWADMPSLIDDAMVDTFTIVAEPGQVGRIANERFGPEIDRVGLSIVGDTDDEALFELIDGFR